MMLSVKVVRGVMALLIISATAGCSLSGGGSDADKATTGARPTPETDASPPQALPPVAAEAEWRAVIDDWYDNGRVDATHRCDAVRMAIDRVPRSGPQTTTAWDDLRRIEAAICSEEPTAPSQTVTQPPASPVVSPGPRCDLLSPGWNVGYQLCQDPSSPKDRGRIEFRGRGSIPIEYPYPAPSGHWSGGFVSGDGKTLLLQWTAECEVPFAYFVPVGGGKPRLVTGERRIDRAPPTIAHGWTSDGMAIVEVLPGCGERGDGELWLISPDGDRLRLVNSQTPG